MNFRKTFFNLITLFLFLTSTFIFNGCKKDPVCLNGGYCSDGTCKCPAGFSGVNCEIDNRLPCEKNNTSQIVFDNWSTNPYDCYINDVYKGRVNALGYLYVTVTSGYYTLKTIQVSGYALYASVYTSSGTAAKCGNLKFTFP